jgi:hypothetical protein
VLRASLILALCLISAGCQTPGSMWSGNVVSPNPMGVGAANDDALWERTVDVLHDYQFQIVREDRLARVIETEYKVGSGCLEPWHHDSVGTYNKLESSLQSIRRRVRITLLPGNGGGYAVSVEAFKEREDLPGVAANSAGGATFSESTPFTRDLTPVVGQSTESRWIPVGRDLDLEQAILASLRSAYTG